MCRDAAVEADIQQLRAELLHREQANGLVQLQLLEEKEERERAQRKVGCRSSPRSHQLRQLLLMLCCVVLR